MDIGDSLYDKEGAALVPQIMAKAQKKQVRLELPIDFVCGNKFSPNANVRTFNIKQGIPSG